MRSQKKQAGLGVFGIAALGFFVLACLAGGKTLGEYLHISTVAVGLSLFCVILDPSRPVSSGARKPVLGQRAAVAESGLALGAKFRVLLLLAAFDGWTMWILITASWAELPQGLHAQIMEIIAMMVLVSTAAILGLTYGPLMVDWWWMIWVGAAFLYALGGFLHGPGAAGRMSAFGGGPNVFARIMVVGLMGLAYFSLVRRKGWALVATPVLLLALVLSGSRGGFVSLVAAAAVLVLFYRSRIGSGRGLLILLAALGAMGLLIGGAFGSVSEYFNQRFLNSVFVEGYTSGRDSLREQAIEGIKSKPLLGSGLGGFRDDYGYLTGLEHPHNLFLNTTAETGVVGLLFLLLLLWAALRGAAASPRRDGPGFGGPGVACFATAFAILVSSQFSGYFLDSRWIWIFALVGLAVSVAPSAGGASGGTADDAHRAAKQLGTACRVPKARRPVPTITTTERAT